MSRTAARLARRRAGRTGFTLTEVAISVAIVAGLTAAVAVGVNAVSSEASSDGVQYASEKGSMDEVQQSVADQLGTSGAFVSAFVAQTLPFGVALRQSGKLIFADDQYSLIRCEPSGGADQWWVSVNGAEFVQVNAQYNASYSACMLDVLVNPGDQVQVGTTYIRSSTGASIDGVGNFYPPYGDYDGQDGILYSAVLTLP